jgi:hypothetical protein
VVTPEQSGGNKLRAKTMQFDLFGMPDNDYQAGTITAEANPEEDQGYIKTRQTVISAIGKNFVVSRCARCSQLMLIDPAYEDQDKGKTCEVCNTDTADKYMKFLKLKL